MFLQARWRSMGSVVILSGASPSGYKAHIIGNWLIGISGCVQQGPNINYGLTNTFLITRMKRSKPSYHIYVGPKLGT